MGEIDGPAQEAPPGQQAENEQTAGKRRFEEMLGRELDSLYRIALRLTRKPEDAEDLVQETLIKAWRSLHAYREDANPRGWLITILYNAYRDHYRKQKRSPTTVPLETDDLHGYEGGREAEIVGGENPEESALVEGISDPVLRAIKELPPGFREPLLLVDLEGFSYGEAAEIMGVLKGTVMSRLHRARARMSRQLAQYVAVASPGRKRLGRKRPDPEQALAKRRAINCGEACRHLHSYVDGLLDAEDTRKIDEHLTVCRRCCDRYEFERRQRALLLTHHLGTTVPRAFLRRLKVLLEQF